MPNQKVTILHAVRYDGLKIGQNVFVRILHDEGMDLMEAIDDCFTAWFKTPLGREVWNQSCCDYNIGDMLCLMAPTREFTRDFGFEVLPETDEDIIEMSYDRVLGHGPEDDDDDLIEERTLAVEQVCECCGRHFWILYHEDGAYDYLDDRGDGPCDCEAEYHPVDGSPSLAEWLESLK